MRSIDICLLSFGYRALAPRPERTFSFKNRYHNPQRFGVVVPLLL